MLLIPNAENQTTQIQRALDDLTITEVILSPGVWHCGPLILRSNLTFRLSKGTILKASSDPSLYPYYSHSVASRMDVFPRRAFLFGHDLEDLTLCGEGLIDFSGDDSDFADGIGDSPDRPYGIHLVACRRVRIEGLRLRNSAYWMARFLQCSDLRLRDLDVFNHGNINNDGLDIDSCENVLVSGCVIDSSDDGIVIKSETRNPCQHIVVSDCIVSSHASAIKLGTASIGGFHHILVHHCVVRPSRSPVMHHCFGYWQGMTGLDVATVDGGATTDVHFDHISIEGVANPIFVRLGNRHSMISIPQNRRREDASPALPPPSENGTIERLSFTNITASDAGSIPCMFAGYAGNSIHDLILRDIRIHISPESTFDPAVEPNWDSRAYPCARLVAGENGGAGAHGAVFHHVEGLVLENVVFAVSPNDPRPAVVYDPAS